MLKEYIYLLIRNWFNLANPPIMMFVGGGGGDLEPGIILYTSNFLFSVTCVTVSKLYLLGDPQ